MACPVMNSTKINHDKNKKKQNINDTIFFQDTGCSHLFHYSITVKRKKIKRTTNFSAFGATGPQR